MNKIIYNEQKYGPKVLFYEIYSQNSEKENKLNLYVTLAKNKDDALNNFRKYYDDKIIKIIEKPHGLF